MDTKVSELIISIRQRTANRYRPCRDWSICRVPSRLREVNQDAYTPQVVSIGPLHSGQLKLEAMEVHKNRYLDSLMQRTTDPSVTFSECVEAIVNLEEMALWCYAEYEDDQNMGGGDPDQRRRLADILLVDGCFILELLLRWTTSGGPGHHDSYTNDEVGFVWMVDCLQRDLMLLENQIPFIVLQRLFELIVRRIPKCPYSSISDLCVLTFGSCLNHNKRPNYDNEYKCRHLLDLIHNCYVLPSNTKTEEPENKEEEEEPENKEKSSTYLFCATKLTECGIKFVTSQSENLLDMKLSDNGVLQIPQLFIHDSTESLLRNLIAFEQCCKGIPHHISSYAILMNRLIQSPRDVEILEHERIIDNCLGRGKDVVNLFNKICNEVFVEHFFFDALYQKITERSKVWWPRNKTVLKRDYCSNPWKLLSIVAASLLLILAVIQTGYTMASYYPH